MSSSPLSSQQSTSPDSAYKSRLILAISILLAAVLLYLSVRKVSWREVWTAIAHCRVALLLAGIGISAVSYFIRGLRWRVLLNTREHLPVLSVFWANSAGYLGNNVLPARAGELIRTAMVSSRSNLSKTFVLTTALSERLMDAIILVIAGTVVLKMVPNKPDWLAKLSGPLLALACIAAALLFAIPLFEKLGKNLLEHLPIPPTLGHRFRDAVEHIADGVRGFHDPKSFSLFLVFTAAIWGLDAYSATVLARALGMYMSISVALLLIVGLAMGSALPSTPGYIGIFQFVAVTVLMPFHFTRAEAIAYILVAQAGALVLTGVLGSIGLLQYRKMSRGEPAR